MTKTLAILLALSGAAQAHVAHVPAMQHAAEHMWLALLLLPLVGHVLWRLYRRRRD
ncbi:MAG: hypothetical protein KDJ27_08275 [Gammaproteobacteria bacterium]|nr:hypothetical protein [Gammaproteobacteria bacterium]MCB1923728.1 hypothetical protein [Gammaproteobacteria bacterium]